MKEVQTLYTATDVKKVREHLLKQQNNKDALTGLDIPDKQAVCDHSHKTHAVRGILHRQSNATLGKIENLYSRYLGWWYPYSLSTFLRQCADYLDRTHKQEAEYYHPGWISSTVTQFKKLNSKQQIKLLKKFEHDNPGNQVSRTALFKKILLSKRYSYDTITTFMNNLGD